MSFYTSLTGLNAATAMLGVTANNISNVGTTGFKRSRADFGDIFATSPLQKSSSTVGQGVSLKQVSQEFSQGNISFSSNALDLAITGDGFFPLRSADGLTDTYTRNGSFSLNEQFNVVNSAGQRLMAATVDSTGSANVNDRVVLTIPQKTSGEAKQTSLVSLGLNFPADAAVINVPFSRTNPASYNKSTAFTVYDNGGNGYLATIYYAKTQNANQNSPFNKWQTYVYVGEDQVSAALAQSTDINGELQYVNQYGQIKSYKEVKDELTTAKTQLISLDELTDKRTSAPASISGVASQVDLSGGTNTFASIVEKNQLDLSNLFSVKVDGSTQPVTVDLSYLKDSGKVLTGSALAAEATKFLNRKFGDETTFNFTSSTALASNPDTNLTITDSRIGNDVKVPLTLSGFQDPSSVTVEELTSILQTQVDNSVLGGHARQRIDLSGQAAGAAGAASFFGYQLPPTGGQPQGDNAQQTVIKIMGAKADILALPEMIKRGVKDITKGADGQSVILEYNQFPKKYFKIAGTMGAGEGPTKFQDVTLSGSSPGDSAAKTALLVIANKKAILNDTGPHGLSHQGITDIQLDPTDPDGTTLMFVYDQKSDMTRNVDGSLKNDTTVDENGKLIVREPGEYFPPKISGHEPSEAPADACKVKATELVFKPKSKVATMVIDNTALPSEGNTLQFMGVICKYNSVTSGTPVYVTPTTKAQVKEAILQNAAAIKAANHLQTIEVDSVDTLKLKFTYDPDTTTEDDEVPNLKQGNLLPAVDAVQAIEADLEADPPVAAVAAVAAMPERLDTAVAMTTPMTLHSDYDSHPGPGPSDHYINKGFIAGGQTPTLLSTTSIVGGGITSATPLLLNPSLAKSPMTVTYDYNTQGFKITDSTNAGANTITIAAGTNLNPDPELFGTSLAKNEILNLVANPVKLNADGLTGVKMLPNNINPLRSITDQRYGMAVAYDAVSKTFTVKSGSTGDNSSISISAISATGAKLFGLKDGAIVKSSTAVRGISSLPAVAVGKPPTVNVTNNFDVNDTNNTFVVTVDGIKGTVRIPPSSTYSLESFMGQLQRGINNLASDEKDPSDPSLVSPATVNGVKVTFDYTNNRFVFTTGTTGSDSFIKISGDTAWGLDQVEAGRGTTSTWIKPSQHYDVVSGAPQAKYIDKDGKETTNGDGFAGLPAWSPIYLDKGELTFNTAGKLYSPIKGTQLETVYLAGGKGALTINVNYAASTQYTSPFAVLSQSQDGAPEGSLVGVTIGNDGLVSASFSNGTQKSLAKILLTNFSSPSGLRQIGDSSFLASAASGKPILGTAGSAGFGTLRAGATERANVDLTQELVDLITAQRNFQANAKAIETSSTMTSAIINLRS